MDTATTTNGRVTPWNKGKLLGEKPPLKLKEIWAIRIRLQLEYRTRGLALFNLAIDSKLRGCVVAVCREVMWHQGFVEYQGARPYRVCAGMVIAATPAITQTSPIKVVG